MKVELKPHQLKAVEELSNGKLLRGDPGVGKSFTALAYFFTKECGGVLNDFGSMKTPKDLYIITTAKKRDTIDWQTDCYKMGLMENPGISVGFVKVTVDSWNNIEKYVDVKDAFFIFDEQKAIGKGKWAKTFVKVAKKNRWVMLTGTPGDTWMDYISVFVANGFYKNKTEFINEHVIYASWSKFPKIERYRQLGRLVRNRNAVLVEMHYDRHTTRHLEVVVVAHNEEMLERVTKRRWNVFENRPLRDVAELFSVSRKVVNSDPSRITKLRELQRKHKRLIVFYNFDYELELLRTLGNPSGSTTMVTTDPSAPGSTINSSPEIQDSWTYLLSSEGMAANESGMSSIGLLDDSSKSTNESHSPNGSNEPMASVSKNIRNESSTTSSGRARTRFVEIGSPAEPSMSGLMEHSTMMDSATPRRHLYDEPSTKPPLDELTARRLTRLTSGKTFSIDELTCLAAGSVPANGVLTGVSVDSSRMRKPTPTGELTVAQDHKTGSISSTSGTNNTPNTTRHKTSPKKTSIGSSPSLTLIVNDKSSTSLNQSPSSSASLSVVTGDELKHISGHMSTSKTSTNELEDAGGDTTGLPIETGSSSGQVVVAEWNGHKHQPVPTSSEWIYLVQYMAGAEAWNCITTDAMAFYSLTYSYKQFEQSQGRIDRMNTSYKDLYYYLLYSESWIDKAIKKALDLKQDFNEKRHSNRVSAAKYDEEIRHAA